ncbi:alkaline phosphatase PhoX, partial [Escherichia coli]|uniref:alkaline phosphatase PhoX n=1 Tax=Escherichia coli TaxID=562 RepID=UPI000CB89224
EWIDDGRDHAGSVYCTLANTSERGKNGKAPVVAAKPRASNVCGHIIHWLEHNGDPTALQFAWDILVMGGRTDPDKPDTKGSMN